jgi:2,3,4,5-tetrahydropyridine-2-carboxylate N-succinyltransferase
MDLVRWRGVLDVVRPLPTEDPRVREAFLSFRDALEAGTLRAASPGAEGSWVVHPEVKEGILLGFRCGVLVGEEAGPLSFVDKDTYPLRRFRVEDRVRVVPGGTGVRRGAYVAPGVVLMPPSYVNVGAYVGEGSMVDSHALVGSCAQVGARVHVSAGCQVGGVIEPVGALPVVVEDEALLGGNTGLYEGVQVGRGAVVGSGVILNGSTVVVDLVEEREYRATPESPLRIPPLAVVVPGSRPARGAFAASRGLHVATPLIIKYRDGKTSARAALEEAVRGF